MAGSMREKRPGVFQFRASTGQRDAAGRYVYEHTTWKYDPQAVGVDPKSGKPLTKVKAATLARDAFAAKVASGEADEPASMVDRADTLADLLRRWLVWGETIKGWEESTARAHSEFCELHLVNSAIGAKHPDSVTGGDLNELYVHLAKRGRTLAHRAHTHLSSAYKWAMRTDQVQKDPTARIEKPSRGEGIRPQVSMDDVLRVLAEAERQGNLAMATLIRVTLAIGNRRGEAAALRWCDIDVDHGVIRVHQAVARGRDGRTYVKSTKTGDDRAIPLDVTTIGMLARWRDECEAPVNRAGLQLRSDGFVWASNLEGDEPWKPARISRNWRRLADACGVSMRFHDVRHTNGSWLVASGLEPAEAARRLGHSPQTLLNTYTHAVNPGARAVTDALAAAIEQAGQRIVA